MKSGSRESVVQSVVPISFGERYVSSAAFDATYKEGMGLVEETAAYLDGQGRKDAKALKGAVQLAFATESMRLTTRLMQLASWLLIRKAVREGEMTVEDAADERRKVRLTAIGRPGHIKDFETLPERMRDLVTRSFGLYDRIAKLDRTLDGSAAVVAVADGEPLPPPTSLDAQRRKLAAAYSGTSIPGKLPPKLS